MPLVYKICAESLWNAAERAGVFAGAGIDLTDGYIHFSIAEQVAETAAKHFAGVGGLVLFAVDTAAPDLKWRWEPSRGGALFPHLYEPLPVSAVRWVRPMPLRPNGTHQIPDLA